MDSLMILGWFLNVQKPKETPSLPKGNQQVGRSAARVLLTLEVGEDAGRGGRGRRWALPGSHRP